MYNYQYWLNETNEKILKEKFTNILLKSGFNILDITEHYFKPYGYTALFLLSESHLAIHTFPEENKTYIELSSCVKEYYDNFLKII